MVRSYLVNFFRKSKFISVVLAGLCSSALVHAETIDLRLNKGRLTKGVKLSNGNALLEYWTKGGEAEWLVNVSKAGEYKLVVQYAADKSSGGGLEVSVNGTVVTVEHLAPTGTWSKFKREVIDLPLNLKSGENTITLRPSKLATQYFINVNRVMVSNAYRGTYDFIPMGLPLQSEQTTEAFIKALDKSRELTIDNYFTVAYKMWKAFPLYCDWILQDNVINEGWGKYGGFDSRGDFKALLTKPDQVVSTMIDTISRELGKQTTVRGDYRSQLKHYFELCKERRAQRLKPLLEKTNTVIYTKHMNMGTIYLATETQGCPGGSDLRKLVISKDGTVVDTQLFNSKNGIVRDPELSFDGKKLLFAWRKTNKNIGSVGQILPTHGHYKIYEMDLASREMRALTNDDTYGADFEPCYLPNGDIMFSSQRCVQEVTCGWGDCSNLFIMNKDGKYARRVGFDQTQTAFPHLLDDGRIVYTRRDYNDRGQSYAHALFTMNPDGTTQTEYYGNNSMAPTSIQHTRQIPGTSKTMGVAGGYHTSQGGKLVVVDPSKGRQNYEGLTFINWEPTPLDQVNNENYCRVGEQYQYPYPLDDKGLLVSFEPIGAYLTSQSGKLNRRQEHLMRYKLYYMTLDGRREMIGANADMSCMQPVPVMERKRPQARGSVVDYKKDTATMYVQNIYYGPGLKGVELGTVKKIRVNEIFYKPITIGAGGWSPSREEVGPGRQYAGYGWHSVLPAGLGSASFDAKQILGEVDVHADGSAMFEVPARKPIYLQMIDGKGDVVQTMRSWATLMPGETFSCVGCHEDKNSTPLQQGKHTIALKQKPQQLKPLHSVSGKPFSYSKMVQPIWDKHCVSCHAPGQKAEAFDLTSTLLVDNNDGKKGHGRNDATQRKFNQSYVTLLDAKWVTMERRNVKRLSEGRPNKWVNYYTRMLTTELIKPYYAGATKSGLLKKLRKGHAKVKLSEAELNTISAWIDLNVPYVGEYNEMTAWEQVSQNKYDKKVAVRHKQETIEAENLKQFIADGQP